MRHLTRPSLPPKVRRYLTKNTNRIALKATAADQVTEAHRLWEQARGTQKMHAVVAHLRTMNQDLHSCMYCEHDHATAFKDGNWRAIIEHWEPVADAPLRAFDWENHLLSCHRCNTFVKHDGFPRDAAGIPELLNPAVDDPAQHLHLIPSTGELRGNPGSSLGQPTIDFLHLAEFDKSRRAVWDGYVKHLERYDAAVATGDLVRAGEIKDAILRFDHRSSLGFLARIATGPNGATLTTAEMPRIVQQHGVATWA